ncbi:D-alanine--D-alanine ligase family protein [Halodesulfovibrio marinisediminis]|uniref:D-alanine--D-alanine ligase n=1 Tax=Halodesulfovibrio marinisediminis DSM 17456 TaxID=1121457 RepID=A0A1N6J124_9BACT|nr:D-alanine--D-alanine ligase [Halodesulfovibrio marinisediminis]SIO37957.1 D-alanine--D-alanine ligase [Halodesulfovibrio marinisediminis DSM 17456]
MNILLIAGGWSSEREVSLNGAKGIHLALMRLGHSVTFFDPQNSLDGLLTAARDHDFAFINLHGSPGEDGMVQALLESVGCPFQGSRAVGSFIALNKSVSKQVFLDNALPTPEWEFLAKRPSKDWRPKFSYPIFIKSNTGGSSLGLSRVANENELQDALDSLFATESELIVEPLIEGVEVTCGVLGNEALPPVLIEPADGSIFFDYEAKYRPGGAREVCPAPLPETITAQVKYFALKAHKVLGLSGYSRADFIYSPDGSLHLLEVNTLPGMTSTSLLPQEAEAVGISFDELIARLIQLGLAEDN